MRLRLIACLVFIVMLIASCQDGPPNTTYVMEVTRLVTVVVTDESSTGSGPLPIGTAESTEAATAAAAASTTATPAATAAANSTQATVAPTLSPTASVFPTPVVGQIYVAEQKFEHGSMFWLQPVKQIWVAMTDDSGKNIWSVYDDTFVDGQPESDPELTPPAGVMQPVRGFGKVWRENADVQKRLGWAVESEVGYVTRYEYRAGGSVKDNEYVFGEGRHLVTMRDGKIIEFNRQDYTWQILDSD